MGVDFISRVGRTFEKHLDLARARLGTADLFSQAPEEARCSFPIDAVGRVSVKRGQELTVEIASGALVLRDVLSVVGRSGAPPSDVLQAIECSCGIATAVVQEVHEISGVIEVTLC